MSPAEVDVPNSCTGASWAVDNPCLSSSAEQVIQEDGAKTLSKVGIVEDWSTYKYKPV